MGIFNFKKKKVTTKTMSELYEELFGELDDFTEKCFKVSGMEVSEMFEGLDEQSGAILGASMSSLKKMMDLCADQACIIDRMEAKLDECNRHLIEMNAKLAR